MSQNSLAVIGDSEWSVLQQQAKALVDSGFLPQSVNTPQKAVAIMMLGRELGIPPWAALSTINVIQGKPTVSPQLMLALINRSGQLANMECIAEPDKATVTMLRRGRVPHTETFTMKDAAALNLTGKDNYKKQPATMLKWRAVAACARVVFPDVILGLYTPEEMGAEVRVDDEGNMDVIDVTPEPERQLPPPTPKAESPSSTPSGSPNGGGSSDKFDRDFPPKAQQQPPPTTSGEQPYTDFLCHELVYTVTNGGSQYTFKAEHGASIVVFGSDWVLSIADYADRDKFKNAPGKVQQLHPPLVVTARFDNKTKKWDVSQITTLEAVTS
jgi:hypothetical protein